MKDTFSFNTLPISAEYSRKTGIDEKHLHNLIGLSFSNPNRPHIVRIVENITIDLNIEYTEFTLGSKSGKMRGGECYWYSFYRWTIGDREKTANDFVDTSGTRLNEMTIIELRAELEAAVTALEAIDAGENPQEIVDGWRSNK